MPSPINNEAPKFGERPLNQVSNTRPGALKTRMPKSILEDKVSYGNKEWIALFYGKSTLVGELWEIGNGIFHVNLTVNFLMKVGF